MKLLEQSRTSIRNLTATSRDAPTLCAVDILLPKISVNYWHSPMRTFSINLWDRRQFTCFLTLFLNNQVSIQPQAIYLFWSLTWHNVTMQQQSDVHVTQPHHLTSSSALCLPEPTIVPLTSLYCAVIPICTNFQLHPIIPFISTCMVS